MKPTISIFVSVLLLLVTGCATYMTTMQNPESGDIEICQAEGAGLIYMAMASSQHDECVKRLSELGYVEVKDSASTVKHSELKANHSELEEL
jgi:hypothetical protein